MSLEKQEVLKISHLARLQIDEKDIDQYTNDLENILGLVEQLDQQTTVAADNIEPMAHPLDINQTLHEDEITEKNHREVYQEQAPATEAGLYLVPKVIE